MPMSDENAAYRLEVSRRIAADPAAVFELLRDPRGHVAVDTSGMLMGSTGGPVSATGETLVVHMDRDALGDVPMGKYDVTVLIVTYDPDREISWSVGRTADEQFGHARATGWSPAVRGLW
jgi:hypothetical protein